MTTRRQLEHSKQERETARPRALEIYSIYQQIGAKQTAKQFNLTTQRLYALFKAHKLSTRGKAK